MAQKCDICNEDISETFLGKLDGTVIKIPEKKEVKHVCSSCQKEHKDKLLEKLNE